MTPLSRFQYWVADITLLPTGEGSLFVATVMDTFSSKVLGWALDMTLQLRSAHDVVLHCRPPQDYAQWHSLSGLGAFGYAGGVQQTLMAGVRGLRLE